MKILLTGATGLVGQKLGQSLARAGHQVVAVSRSRAKAVQELTFPCEIIEADLTEGPLPQDLLGEVEGVVHLMGESIAGARWNESQKEKILSTRVESTRNLRKSFANVGTPLRVWVQASAVGIYGDEPTRGFDESSEIPIAKDNSGVVFLQNVCREWESAFLGEQPQTRYIDRSVILRLGVVLAESGGALEQLRPLFSKGLGAALGNGQQWMSWIHIDDLIAMVQWALFNDQVQGVYNAVAPDAVTNQEFSSMLAQVLKVNLGPRVPSMALKVVVGEMAAMLLASQKVVPEKALKQGFQFQFPLVRGALESVNQSFQGGESVFISEQYLPLPPAEIFPFFSEASNLEQITPENLNFHVVEMSTPQIQEGTLIQYRLKIHGVPVGWTTEIQSWQPPFQFVDTQLKGPYQLWHHTHQFQPLGAGTLMRDVVRYRLPMGKLGSVVAGSFVRGDVEKIFAHRRKVCAAKFF